MPKDFKEKVREQFARTAEGYVRNKGFATGDDLAEAVRLLKPTPEDTLLDVACGGGHTALYFAPLVRSVVASDLTMQMLKRAQEYISEEGGVENVTFREADAEDLPFPAGAFTLLTCRIAPHHFPDVPRALQEFHRVLRRGGRMVIIDTLLPDDPEIAEFYQTMEKMRDQTHVRAYRKDEWTRMVEEAGFHSSRNEGLSQGARLSGMGPKGRAEQGGHSPAQRLLHPGAPQGTGLFPGRDLCRRGGELHRRQAPHLRLSS